MATKVSDEGELHKSKEDKTCEWKKPLKKASKADLSATKPRETGISSYLKADRSANKSTILSKEQIASKLFCTISKSSLLDSEEPMFGYPIDIIFNSSEQTVLNPLTEVISFDAFMLNFLELEQSTYTSCSQKFLSGLRLQYAVWLPMYIDDSHFERSKHHLLGAILQLHKMSVDVDRTEIRAIHDRFRSSLI